MVYRCNLCVYFVGETLPSLLNHLRRIHKNDPGFHALCGVNGCSRTYRNFYSLKCHFYRNHADLLSNIRPEHDGTDDDSGAENFGNGDLDENQEIIENQFDIAEEARKLTRSNALCILQVKDEGKIPQTVVDYMVKNTTEIVENSVDVLKSALKDRMKDVGLDMENIPEISDLFGEDSVIRKPFLYLANEASQSSYYKSNFGLVEPKKLVLGSYHSKGMKGNKVKDVLKEDCAYYIPLLASLQQLLNNDSVLEEIENPHNRTDDLMSDYCDAEDFKRHPLFSIDFLALQILFFFDELEICNPLGSRANIHKLGNFYYTLGNISPNKRASYRSIQLFAIVNSNHLKQYGIDRILEVLINDIRLLEQDEGYAFNIHGQMRNFRGTIAYASGDNLGSQQMGGFKEGAQAYRKCRECMTTMEELISKFLESFFTLRTRENHEMQCQRLNGELKDYFSRSYGLNRRSLLNDSRYFHVIGGLPQDAMHDILEGVLQYCVKEVLKVYIMEKKFLTLQELNKRIVSFDYGYHNASNKPAKILRQKLFSDDHNLKQHANEMWCLSLYLPFLIGECVPDNDEHWDLFCLLLQIIRIVFSPTISKGQIPYLQVLIQQHHEKFKELFPDCPIIPKMHYMVHMPRTILRLGPLSRVWCMRYEAKHSYFKRLAMNIRNFINLPYTLAKRHQESLCYYLQTPDGSASTFLSKGNETGPGKSNLAGNLNYFTLLERSERQNGNLVDNQTPVYEPKWVIINGTKYKPGAILHIGFDEDDFPYFWKIHKICVVNKSLHDIKFIVLPLETTGFHNHFQSYQVQMQASAKENMKIFQQKEFTCYLPTNLCTPYGNQAGGKFVCSRYEYDTNN